MKKIRILGDIAEKYKDSWELDVLTPPEAIRAIEANRQGFIRDLDGGEYVLVLVDESNPDDSRQVANEESAVGWGDEILYIVPNAGGDWAAAVAIGAWAAGTTVVAGAVVGGALAVAVTYAIAAVVMIAVTIAVSMIASLIVGSPGGVLGANDTEDSENKTSYIYNGVVNTARQGHRIPVCYGGPILVGSMILSSRINVQDVAT